MSVTTATQVRSTAAQAAGGLAGKPPTEKPKAAEGGDRVQLSSGQLDWQPPKQYRGGQEMTHSLEDLNRPGQLRMRTTDEKADWYVPSGKDVELNDEQRQVADDLGAAYKEKTGRSMRVTSGTRTTEETASELYGDITRGKADEMYGNGSAKREYQELRDVYMQSQKEAELEGLTGPEREAYTRDQMKRKLDEQVAEKRYLSNHLAGKSLDISTMNSSPEDIQAMRDLAKERNLPLKDEGDHLHIDLPGAPVSTDARDTASKEEVEGRSSWKTWAKRLVGYGEA